MAWGIPDVFRPEEVVIMEKFGDWFEPAKSVFTVVGAEPVFWPLVVLMVGMVEPAFKVTGANFHYKKKIDY